MKGSVAMVQDKYKEPIILDIQGVKVRVFRPELTPEEQKKRMKAIHDAAAELLKGAKT